MWHINVIQVTNKSGEWHLEKWTTEIKLFYVYRCSVTSVMSDSLWSPGL